MPRIKSAQKQERVSQRKQAGNKAVRTRCKSSITKAEKLIFSGELELVEKATLVAISSLDKAAEKGIVHSNNAARRKSRLMKKLNEARASSKAK